MYRELIDHLAFVYGFVCKGRGKVPQADLRTIRRQQTGNNERDLCLCQEGGTTGRSDRGDGKKL